MIRWEYCFVVDKREYVTNVIGQGKFVNEINIKMITSGEVFSSPNYEDALRTLGRQGWELVSVIEKDIAEIFFTYYYFKRPLVARKEIQ